MECYECGNRFSLESDCPWAAVPDRSSLEESKGISRSRFPLKQLGHLVLLYCVLHRDGGDCLLNPIGQRITPSRLLAVVFSKRLVPQWSSVTLLYLKES